MTLAEKSNRKKENAGKVPENIPKALRLIQPDKDTNFQIMDVIKNLKNKENV